MKFQQKQDGRIRRAEEREREREGEMMTAESFKKRAEETKA